MTATPKKTAGTTLVRDIMQTSVIAVRPDRTVRELIRVLVDNSIHGVPVVDYDDRLVGVVSMTDVLQLADHDPEIPAGQVEWKPVVIPEEVSGDDDIVRSASLIPFTEPATEALGEATFDQVQVRDIMTPVAFTLSADDTIETAVAFLLRGRIHRAIVANGNIIEGIVTPFDVLMALDW